MCDSCGAEASHEQQIEFVKRYLEDQQSRLSAGPEDHSLKAEVEKTRELLNVLLDQGRRGEVG